MKPIWIVVISVIVAGAIIGGGIYYYQNKKLADAKKDLNSQITTLQTQVNNLKASNSTTTATPSNSTTTTDETADWKTYKVSDLSISFKYPKEWGDASLQQSAGESGISKKITFSNKTDSSNNTSGIFAGFASPDFSAGRSSSGYEMASIHEDYFENKTCAGLKAAPWGEGISNCQILTAKNAKKGVIFNNTQFDMPESIGYYFTGRADYPAFGIEIINSNKYLEDFKKIIESIDNS